MNMENIFLQSVLVPEKLRELIEFSLPLILLYHSFELNMEIHSCKNQADFSFNSYS